VDVAATGPSALLVEVKDDRIKDVAAKGRRKKAVQKGAFLGAMSLKFRHSAEDILAIAVQPGRSPFYEVFAVRWQEQLRLLVLWWELPPEPPSGEGTRDDRWKAHLSSLQNKLKQDLHKHNLIARLRIANQRFCPHVVHGMDVADVAAGIAGRRESLRSRSSKSPKAPT
jgi:hypothetical protein